MSELQTTDSANLLAPEPRAAVVVPLALIADANAASRRRRTRQLEKRGFRVAVARTGFEAIVKASCRLPDVIVLAASLGEDADDTTKLLSSCPATAHIPIVQVAARHRLPVRLDAGAR